jgi:hypothetical protein
MWFEALTGFTEQSPQQVRANIRLEGNSLRSHANGKSFICGELETPSLAELRERVQSSRYHVGKMSVHEVVADVQNLHADESYAGSLFQVASQFNLLEMGSPRMTPEDGVDIYEHDHTQGPACAISAGAGTIYRNYFAAVNGQIGQSSTNQIDCLGDIGDALGNTKSQLWEMKNGYALATYDGLIRISNQLRGSSESELDRLRQLLRIGIQWNTQVTLNDAAHLVSQAYCSALPVAYCRHSSNLWAEFAKLVLEAAYEATVCTAILNSAETGNNRMFLTLLGGGAFGNETAWIIKAIERALKLYRHIAFDVSIDGYGSSNQYTKQRVDEIHN